MKAQGFVLSFFVLSACVSPVRKFEKKSQALIETKTPQRTIASKLTFLSATKKSSDEVALYRQRQNTRFIPAPVDNKFKLKTMDDKVELKKLEGYLTLNKVVLGLKEDNLLNLKLKSFRVAGERLFVRMQQVAARSVNGRYYSLPIKGSDLSLIFKKNKDKSFRLDSIASSLSNPPNYALRFYQKQGFSLLKLSDFEIKALISHIKKHPNLEDYQQKIEPVFQEVDENFNLIGFLDLPFKKQKQSLKKILLSLKKDTTQLLTAGLAETNRLALVQYQDEWFVQAQNFLDLPIEVDFLMPKFP